MLILRSTNTSGNASYGRRMSPLIRLPSPPRSPNKAHPQRLPCLTGVPTSQMYSQNKPMPNYCLITITTTPLTFNQHSPPILPRSIHLTQLSCKSVKSSLMNTWRWDRSYPPNLSKLLCSFSYPKKMVPYVLARTTDILIPTPSGMCTSAAYLRTHWRHEGCHPLHEVRHQMGL